VIAFLSAIMKKTGDNRDRNRRLKHVNKLQDSPEWHKSRALPPPNAKWPTCLIIVPATVVHNWERELETWGYFEVGIYAGTPKQRAPVLRDFELGRLDIGMRQLTSETCGDTDILGQSVPPSGWHSKISSCLSLKHGHVSLSTRPIK
jgi:SNF2-related domain